MTDNEFRKRIQLLQKTLEQINAQLNTIAINNKADTCDGDPERPQLVSIPNLEIRLPPSITSYYHSENDDRESKTKWKRIEFCIALGGLVAVVAYVIVTYCTLREIKKQARSAEVQIEIMQQQLDSTNRPWLGLNPSVTIEWINVSKQGVGARLVIPVKNYGNSPVIQVGIGVMATTANMTEGQNQFKNHSNVSCATMESTAPWGDRKVGFGGTIFPGITVSQTRDTASNGEAFDPQSELQIIGCITYEFPSTKVHHSRFCLESQKPASDFKAGDVLFTCQSGNTVD